MSTETNGSNEDGGGLLFLLISIYGVCLMMVFYGVCLMMAFAWGLADGGREPYFDHPLKVVFPTYALGSWMNTEWKTEEQK